MRAMSRWRRWSPARPIARAAEEYGLPHDQIILSAKVSGVQDLIDVYRELAKRCDYPLHLGLTEAGMGKGHRRFHRRLAPCCRKGSATPSAFRLHPSPTAIERKRCVSLSRSCNHSAFAASRRRLPPVPAADAQRPPSSRNWLTRFRPICAIRCRGGKNNIPVWKK